MSVRELSVVIGPNERSFLAGLKRRNVYRVPVAYAVVGWLVMQVTATVIPALHLPDASTSTNQRCRERLAAPMRSFQMTSTPPLQFALVDSVAPASSPLPWRPNGLPRGFPARGVLACGSSESVRE